MCADGTIFKLGGGGTVGSGLAGFLKVYPLTHYAVAAPLTLALPGYMFILTCCLTLDKDTWIFKLRLQNSDYLFGKGHHEKRG